MTTLLAILMAGQCINGSCSLPLTSLGLSDFAPQRVFQGAYNTPSYQVVDQVANRIQPDYNWHPIEHNGVKFNAWGYVVLKADGRRVISWDAELAENKSHFWKAFRAQEALKEAHRNAAAHGIPKHSAEPDEPAPAKVVEPEPDEPKPSAKIGPYPDPQLPQRSGEQDKLPTDRKLTLAKMGDNFGIDTSKLGQRLGYTENGHPVSTKRVENKLEKPLEPRSYVVVIGTPEERKAIEADWKNDDRFRPYRDLAWLTPFGPDDWQVKGMGFANGHPSVIVETSNKTVVGHTDTYTGPDDVIEGLRRAHPRYNPSNDKPLGKALAGWSIDRPRVIAAGIFGVAMLMVAMLPRRKP